MKYYEVPDQPGVYALFAKGKCLYVGSATRLRRRVNVHKFAKKWRKPFDEVEIKICDIDNIRTVEQEWLERLNPSLNVNRAKMPVKVPIGTSISPRQRLELDFYCRGMNVSMSRALEEALEDFLRNVAPARMEAIGQNGSSNEVIHLQPLSA